MDNGNHAGNTVNLMQIYQIDIIDFCDETKPGFLFISQWVRSFSFPGVFE